MRWLWARAESHVELSGWAEKSPEIRTGPKVRDENSLGPNSCNSYKRRLFKNGYIHSLPPFLIQSTLCTLLEVLFRQKIDCWKAKVETSRLNLSTSSRDRSVCCSIYWPPPSFLQQLDNSSLSHIPINCNSLLSQSPGLIFFYLLWIFQNFPSDFYGILSLPSTAY
jgi:hypothetical protein